jgi:hypothetical protein
MIESCFFTLSKGLLCLCVELVPVTACVYTSLPEH